MAYAHNKNIAKKAYFGQYWAKEPVIQKPIQKKVIPLS